MFVENEEKNMLIFNKLLVVGSAAKQKSKTPLEFIIYGYVYYSWFLNFITYKNFMFSYAYDRLYAICIHREIVETANSVDECRAGILARNVSFSLFRTKKLNFLNFNGQTDK